MTLVDETTQPTTAPSGRRRRSEHQMVTGGVLVLIGALWLLERLGAIDLSATAVLALATMVVGFAVMVTSWRRSATGLAVFGTLLAFVTLLTAMAPLEGFQGGVGDRDITVSRVEDLDRNYDLAMGQMVIDLTEIERLEGPTELVASIGMGDLVVVVPPGVAFEVDARVGAGEIEILGERWDGVGVDATHLTDGFGEGDDGYLLDLRVGFGRVEVRNG